MISFFLLLINKFVYIFLSVHLVKIHLENLERGILFAIVVVLFYAKHR